MYFLMRPSAPYVPAAPKLPEVVELRNYTPLELLEFDGKDGKKIYFAVNRKVLDVTKGRSFYGPGGMYGNFAGRDASRGLAKNSFDEDMLSDPAGKIDTLEDLEEDEKQSLKEWAQFMENKYTVVGYLIENDEKEKQN
ncbi:hypothetical protein HK098_004117 [Nowakowskiella sp. JEL0407]|nr:hypothetical protein HK098_004117 [Nowakowskiella sp. JEL0407]